MDTTTVATRSQLGSLQIGRIFPDVLWIAFWLIIFLSLRKQILNIAAILIGRLRHGANVKIGSFELQGLRVSTGSGIPNINIKSQNDIDCQRSNEREDFYAAHRGIMTVHKVYKSREQDQLYDVLIYQIPHNSANLIQLAQVEYSFGKMWGNMIYVASDRSTGFAVATSAYGPFVCSAKLVFNDGASSTIFRYIDFEMGDVAAFSKDDSA
jgi:hypothetical protein